MLHFIDNLQHPLLEYIKDDPVRPEIPLEFRVSQGRRVLAIADDERPTALVCVSFHNTVPTTVDGLLEVAATPTTAVFYTIWSYAPGAGRNLLQEAVLAIRQAFPSVSRFVTLSPKTELARKFHIRNGAIVLQENENTVNYEYIVTAS